MKIAPPEGIGEEDYEAIEAAVMETVRGRWFLSEFARRSRVDEMRQMLDAMVRLEQVVTEQRALPADPSIRLLVQRLKDVAQQLDGLAADMRVQGHDETLCWRIESQARAVGGVLRLNAPTAVPAERTRAALRSEAEAPQTVAPPPPPLPAMSAVSSAAEPQNGPDPRLAGLARLDALPRAEKLALFR